MAEIFYYDASDIITQGNITSSGNSSSNIRVRSIIYIKLPFYDCQNISIHVESEKPINVDLLGYSTNSTNSPLFDLYWYENDYIFDVSSYNKMRYVRFVIKYEDNTNIVPSDIKSCILTFTYNDFLWHVFDKKISNEYLVNLPSNSLLEPYPESIWRINNDKLVNLLLPTLPSKTISHPYPDSIWRVNNDKLVNELLPLLPDASLEKPYPDSIWRKDNDDSRLINLLLGHAQYSVNPAPEDDPEKYKDPNREL